MWWYVNSKGYMHKQQENGQYRTTKRAFCTTDYLLKDNGTIKESADVGKYYYDTLEEAIQDLYQIWDFKEETDCTNKEVTA